jgi:hypothetical protein
MRKRSMILAGIAAMLFAAPSSATTLLFKMSEIGGDGEQYSFMLNSNPTLASVRPRGVVIGPTQVTGTGPGVGDNYIFFGYFSGLQIRTGLGRASKVVGTMSGSDLISGTGSAMTLNTGDFRVSGSSGTFDLKVAALPEPATWATMLLGFGAMGFLVRARRAKGAVASA